MAGVALSNSVRDLLEATLRGLTPSPWRWIGVALLLGLTLFVIGAAVCIAADGWPVRDDCPHILAPREP